MQNPCTHKMSRRLKFEAQTKPQIWNNQYTKKGKKKKKKKKKKKHIMFIHITSLWKHPFCLTLLNHLPKVMWKKNIYKHGVWLLRNASSQSVRTTGCIQGSRENKHRRMSFLHTWCFSQPQIPKLARDAAEEINFKPTCSLPYKGLNTLGFRCRECAHVHECTHARTCVRFCL